MQMLHAKRFIISGIVQGVFYRASTKKIARQLGLTGWVRNLPSQQVEVLACGTDEQLAALEAWLWKGPDAAVVSHIDINDESVDTDLPRFNIR